MQTIKTLCKPRDSVFTDATRDDVLNLSDLLEEKIDPNKFFNETAVIGFEESTLRLVLAAIHVAVKEDEMPDKGLWHIKNNIADYWGNRDMLKQLLSFLKDTRDISNMLHWAESAQMAEHLYILVDNDHI